MVPNADQTGGKDMEEQKASFYLKKAEYNNKPRSMNVQRPRNKVTKKTVQQGTKKKAKYKLKSKFNST